MENEIIEDSNKIVKKVLVEATETKQNPSAENCRQGCFNKLEYTKCIFIKLPTHPMYRGKRVVDKNIIDILIIVADALSERRAGQSIN